MLGGREGEWNSRLIESLKENCCASSLTVAILLAGFLKLVVLAPVSMSLSRSCSLKLTTLGTAFAVVILGTFTSAYAVSIANGHIFYPWYFLSSSIDYAPGSCIGSFGLSPSTLLCVPILSWVRFTQVREVSDSRANRWMLYSSILSAIGAHGVASVQAHADLLVHLLFAGLFFGFGLVVAVLAVVQDYQCPKLGETDAPPSPRVILSTWC